MASENVGKVRRFWHRFFNEGIELAFDELAHEEYRQNGKPSDGAGLKKWLQSVRVDIDINVAITREIETENRVAIHWITNPIDRQSGNRLESNQGINILEFADGKVINNWHCRER